MLRRVSRPQVRSAVLLAILDYGMGNVRSVLNACVAVGAEAAVTRDPAVLRAARGLLLPGVGAFGDAMAALRAAGLIESLEREVREEGKPFLGICLGMQLLATRGTEHGDHAGLGWIAGRAERLAAPGLRLPHVGWNAVRVARSDGAFAGLGSVETFYFTHGYALVPDDPSVASGLCDHGGPFVAAVEAGNLWAVQFHPEKSQRAGLAVLRNFAERARTW